MSLLEHMIRDILGKLQVLADGATQNLDPNRVTENAAKSKPPAGASIRSSDLEPKKEHVSLYEFYRWQFERHAGDEKMLRTLWMLACDDYEDFRFKADHRIAVRNAEEVENDPHDGGKAERVEAERVIGWYEGKPPLYVAVAENNLGAIATEAWVRKVRRQHGRNPEDGKPLPEFLELDDDARRRRVASLAAKMGKKAAAKRLGVDPTTVRRYWPKSATEPVAA